MRYAFSKSPIRYVSPRYLLSRPYFYWPSSSSPSHYIINEWGMPNLNHAVCRLQIWRITISCQPTGKMPLHACIFFYLSMRRRFSMPHFCVLDLKSPFARSYAWLRAISSWTSEYWTKWPVCSFCWLKCTRRGSQMHPSGHEIGSLQSIRPTFSIFIHSTNTKELQNTSEPNSTKFYGQGFWGIKLLSPCWWNGLRMPHPS